MKFYPFSLVLIFCCVFSWGTALSAEPKSAPSDPRGNLTQQSDEIKEQLIQLNRDLFLLEEDLLQPASTRVAVYLSMDDGSLFDLESIKLKIDNKFVSSFLYTDKDLQSLKRGAIQPLFQGNFASGEHEVVVFVTGVGPHQRAYKKAVNLKFNKEQGEKALKIQLVDDVTSQQPQLSIKTWN
ncbi:MAG: AraC family transcriptional regulator [Gammaproteobacteria bacterium CG22_combo_CG10-13_8_21_14_all_40_8]|nr:MAG: AraC family transcriptional regulator [Gammaproteobacteria bacterium CG22_combo_CG10-13_8_21_14_all_40_8]